MGSPILQGMVRAGRPRKYGRAALSHMTRFRSLRTEDELWKKTARDLGKSFSEWAREALNVAAKAAAASPPSDGPGAAPP